MIDNEALIEYGAMVRESAVPDSTPIKQYVPDYDIFWGLLSSAFMTVFGYYSPTKNFVNKYSPFGIPLKDGFHD